MWSKGWFSLVANRVERVGGLERPVEEAGTRTDAAWQPENIGI